VVVQMFRKELGNSEELGYCVGSGYKESGRFSHPAIRADSGRDTK
jgi:secreted Zn-dependent insulinase-like peptidase